MENVKQVSLARVVREKTEGRSKWNQNLTFQDFNPPTSHSYHPYPDATATQQLPLAALTPSELAMAWPLIKGLVDDRLSPLAIQYGVIRPVGKGAPLSALRILFVLLQTSCRS